MGGSASRRSEVVAHFATFGALVDPRLLDDLADDPAGPVRVQAVLAGLREVPFHVDHALWREIEAAERHGATAAPEPVRPMDEEAARARKEALRRKAAAIYDGRSGDRDDEADDEEGALDNGLDDARDETRDALEDGPDDGAAGRSAGAADRNRMDAAQRARSFRVSPRSDWRPEAAQHEGRIEVVQDMTGSSTCEGTTADFVTFFRDRYEKISRMLRQRRELRNAIPVERVRGGQQEVQIIGMVVEKAVTKNGHRRVEVEDPTGAITCIVNSEERQLTQMADTLLSDEVIGVIGQASQKGDVLFLTGLLRPDLPRPDPAAPKGTDAPLMTAFLSDIHVGSNTFLTENWQAMLEWLSGHGATKRERDLAGRIKYLLIPGDLVDGVGIYPGQEGELTIPDVYDQYGAFGDWMQSLPDHLQLVVQPGNHDASRPAEPQPAFTREVRERFDHHHARFVANPAWFRMHGVLTLGYHGSSLIDFATTVTNLEYEKPLPAMKQMLQSRHLAPLYGERTPMAPEHEDYLVVNDIPDLFITGHVHVPGIDTYRGVTMINCGTWQSQTLYQKMLSFTPDPARMPLLDLQTMRGTLVDFQTPRAA
jgi:DNA polymerase II small subunit